MSPLRQDAEKSPIYHLVIVLLIAVGIVSMPSSFLFSWTGESTLTIELLGRSSLRLIASVFSIFIIYKYGFNKIITLKADRLGILFCIPALLVCVFNFPFVCCFSGGMVATISIGQFILYVIYCFSIAVFEETVFRGIILPLLYLYFKDKKYKTFLTVLVSSLLFGAVHFINLINGSGFLQTLLQVGYTFLIGGMFAITLILTKSIIFPIILHFIYDLGGLLLSSEINFATGNQWDTLTVILTAVLGVITFIIYVYLIIKNKDKDLTNII